MFAVSVALALLLTPDLSAVSARFGTPTMVLPGGNLFLTSDGKLATNGETWIDLATEKTVLPPMPGISRRLHTLLADGNFVLQDAWSVTRHSGKTGEFLTTLDVKSDDRLAIDPSGRKLARPVVDETGCRVELADWPTGKAPPVWTTLATPAGVVIYLQFNPTGSHLFWVESPPEEG